MKQNRRQFIKTSALAAAALTTPNIFATTAVKKQPLLYKKMKLSWTPYNLQLRHVFTISGFREKPHRGAHKIEFDGLKGYGEASSHPI